MDGKAIVERWTEQYWKSNAMFGVTPWQGLANIIDAALAEERERAAKIAEADPNPCEHCNYSGETPDFRGKDLAAAIRGAK